MKTSVKLLAIIAIVAVIGFSMAGCDKDDNDGGDTHTHSYSATWSYNETQHWHECSCGDKKDEADHNWNTETGLCDNNCGALSYSLGDTGPGGGKIFYLSETGFTMTDDNSTAHYLEAAPVDMVTTLAWASTNPTDYSSTNITGTATEIGTGRKNTVVILATDTNAPVAKDCNDYDNGGKTDWFLPSKDELNQLYVNRNSVGNLKTTVDLDDTYLYWSSSQAIMDNSAWLQNFNDGGQGYSGSNKERPYSVRAVRAF